MNWHRFGTALAAATLLAGCARATGTASPFDDTVVAAGRPVTLFDGGSLEGWKQVGPGRFVVQPDGTLLTEGGMGMLYYTPRRFRDFVLELDYKTNSPGANSGIFVRFPEQSDDVRHAINAGYEIQIDDSQDALRRTGSVYTFSPAAASPSRPAGEWNHYRIQVTGQRYQVWLNGVKVNDFIGNRGREGYIGLQNHDADSKVAFRNVRVTPLRDGSGPESLGEMFAVREQRAPIRVLMVTGTHGWRHADAIKASKEVFAELSRSTEFRVDTTENVGALTRENLANYDVLFFNNATLRNDVFEAPRDSTRVISENEQRIRKQMEERAGGGAAQDDGYALTLTTPQGEMRGRLRLREDGGTIQIADSPELPLQGFTRNGSQVAFSFDAGERGRPQVRATLEGTALNGTVTVGDMQMKLAGSRGGEAARPAAPAQGGPPRSTSPDQNGFVSQDFAPVTQAQRDAIRDFVRSGKGLVVTHAGLDALYGWEDYREMVGGGLFEKHPWTQPVRIDVEDHENPATRHLDDSFWVRDEIYVLDQNPRWNSHVLLSLNMPSVGVQTGSADATRDDYPISWIRNFGQGRVFATKLGHFPDVWRNPAFLQHLLQGMRIAAGRVPADFSGHRVKETIARNVWPDDLAIDERGNVWIAELTGKVYRYDAATKQNQLVATLPTTDPMNIEHGILGIEVDPNFHRGEPYVYIFYTEPETFINKLSRFTYRDGKIDLASEKRLLNVPTEPACCHQAGDLEWGPGQTLFISTGDTGQSGTKPEQEITEERIAAFSERNQLSGYHWSRLTDSERTSQNLQELRGKVLRIHKDGSIPKDNPFYGRPGVRWEIFAYGLRNPYRIKWDDETKRLFIGIVGPDEQTTYDWYDVSRGGENFGWPRTTGRLFYNEWTPRDIAGYVPPIWEYTYATGGRSASGGPLYRSSGQFAFPQLQGKVVTYDWSRKWIKYGDLVNGTFQSDTVGDVRTDGRQFTMPAKRLANIKTFDTLTGTSPISMEVGPDGCIYVAEFDGFWRAPANSKANISRYCWVQGSTAPPETAAAATTSGATQR